MRNQLIKPAAMTPDQQACWQLVCDLVHGEHHAPDAVYSFGRGIKVSLQASKLSTFDFNELTRLVFLAHDRCIRVELCGSSPGRIGLALHKRHHRDGGVYQRHPTLRQAVAEFRHSNLEPVEG
jgi:hypothetical protein